MEPVVRAHSLAGVFANTARAKVTEGSNRSMAMAVKERHRLQISKKQSKPRYEEVMREGHMATLSAMFTRTKKDKEALPDIAEILMHTQAAGTTITFSSAWLRFIKWCTTVDKSIPMPAAPTTVMRYRVLLYRHAIEKDTVVGQFKNGDQRD